MKKYSSGLREQNGTTKREGQRDETGGSKLRYHEKPAYTSARDLGPILRQPKPSWDRYTLAKIPQRMEFELSRENEANHKSSSNENTPLEQRSPPKPKATSTLTPHTSHNDHRIPKTRANPPLPPHNTHQKYGSSTSQQHPQVSRPRAVASQHHPTTSGMQDSRQVRVLVPRTHTNQRNDSQPLVNSSYPSDRFIS
ncbi:hypothetical protein EAF00_005189 [Botryotinia globosa]|nr:hypothetical protein EAF00_005189 [Botryotinia globosa]